ncbi:hypothetical protein L6R53_16915 [Myxococcota bacterium]|nr:hypothetical protein [Myxococcota bacterium]
MSPQTTPADGPSVEPTHDEPTHDEATETGRPEQSWEYELRGSDGRSRGLVDLLALRAMVYSGVVDSRCKVRPPPVGPAWPPLGAAGRQAAWVPVTEVPALRQVFDVMGVDPQEAEGERRIAGWRKASQDGDEPTSGAQEISQVIRAVSPPPRDRLPLAWLVVGTVILLLVFLVVGLVLS